MGRCAFSAKARNSAETHSRVTMRSVYPKVASRPGVPNGEGTATVNPRSTRCCASPRTSGVRPGTSGMSTTPGPLPFSYTSWVSPPPVKDDFDHPSRVATGAELAMGTPWVSKDASAPILGEPCGVRREGRRSPG